VLRSACHTYNHCNNATLTLSYTLLIHLDSHRLAESQTALHNCEHDLSNALDACHMLEQLVIAAERSAMDQQAQFEAQCERREV
jgi:hypothetical protein